MKSENELEFHCIKCNATFNKVGVYSYNNRFKKGYWNATCPNCWNSCSIQGDVIISKKF